MSSKEDKQLPEEWFETKDFGGAPADAPPASWHPEWRPKRKQKRISDNERLEKAPVESDGVAEPFATPDKPKLGRPKKAVSEELQLILRQRNTPKALKKFVETQVEKAVAKATSPLKGQFFGVPELCEALNRKERTVIQLLIDGRVPGAKKIGGRWFVHRTTFLKHFQEV